MGRTVYPRRSEVLLRSSPRPNKNENNKFGLILWDGSSGPVKRCSSIDTQAEPYARKLCHCSLLRDSMWIKRVTQRIVLKVERHKMHTEYQTQQDHYSTMILWKDTRVKGK